MTHHGHRYQVPHRAGPSLKPAEKPFENSGVEGPPERTVIIMMNQGAHVAGCCDFATLTSGHPCGSVVG